MPAPEKISVVITNYNGRANLEAYLPQVLAAFAHVPEHEVLIVDDASTDTSLEYLAQAHPEVRVERHEVNQGFPVTAHTGFKAAVHPWVFLLSSDMVPEPRCIERMYDTLVENPDVMTVSGPQIHQDGGRICGRFRGHFWKGSLRVRAHEIDPTVNDGRIFHQFQSAVGLYRKSIYMDVGGFCELFVPFYFEEVDLSFRAWKLGYRLLFDPAARITHHTEDSSISAAHGERARKAHHRIHQFYLTWKNISHPWFMLTHGAWLTGRLALSWAWGDWPIYRAVAGWFRQVEVFRRKRADLLARAQRSDVEVLAISGATLPTPSGSGA